LIENNFNHKAFSPENSDKLFDLFKKHFHCDDAYWKKGDIDNNGFYVELKKYGENRKQVFLQFFFSNSKSPKKLKLSLVDDELNAIDNMQVEISFSEIWKDHSILLKQLKEYLKIGLELAEKINN
jgi:hypothetical protein